MRVLAAALAMGVGTWAADPTPNLYFNLTVSDMSALWQWATPPSPPAWSTNFSSSQGDVGEGASVHWCDASSAGGRGGDWQLSSSEKQPVQQPNMLIYTLGAGLYIHGTLTGHVSPQPLGWSVDEDVAFVPWPTTDVLYGFEQEWGHVGGFLYRRVEFVGTVGITGVTITMGMMAQAPDFESVPRTAEPFVIDGQPNPFYTLDGAWSVSDHVGSQAPVEHTSLVGAKTASLTFSPPANTSFMQVYGTMGPESDEFYVAWDPQPPWWFTDENIHFPNASNPWYYPGALMYQRPVDPGVRYNVTITQTIGQGSSHNETWLGLQNVTFYSGLWDGNGTTYDPTTENGHGGGTDTPGGPKSGGSKSINSATLAGAVVGSVVGSLLLAGLVFVLFRRRRNGNPARELSDGDSKFEVDDSVDLDPNPFPTLSRRQSGVSHQEARDTGMEARGVKAIELVSPLFTHPTPMPWHSLASNSTLSPHTPSPQTTPNTSTPHILTIHTAPPFSDTQPSASAVPLHAKDMLSPAAAGPQHVPFLSPISPHSLSPHQQAISPLSPQHQHVSTPVSPGHHVAQEVDGGSYVLELVPPIYDPNWAAAQQGNASAERVGQTGSPT